MISCSSSLPSRSTSQPVSRLAARRCSSIVRRNERTSSSGGSSGARPSSTTKFSSCFFFLLRLRFGWEFCFCGCLGAPAPAEPDGSATWPFFLGGGLFFSRRFGFLVAGVALAVKSLRPEVAVYGVETRRAASYAAAVAAGAPTPFAIKPTLADGLAVATVGANAFAIAQAYCDGVFRVEEKDVAMAVLGLLENEKVVVEGAGATAVAALLPGSDGTGRLQRKGEAGEALKVVGWPRGL